jgi:hypothetical protein
VTYSSAARSDRFPVEAHQPSLSQATAVDLPSIRLVLRQHLDELRQRGADEAVLAPIEAELRRYDLIEDATDLF